jgi:hypothetical protein
MAIQYTKWPYNIPNGHTIYQMAIQYSKWPYNIPNGRSIFKIAVVYSKWPQYIPKGHKLYQHFPFQGPQKFTQIWIFGRKINHLATPHT